MTRTLGSISQATLSTLFLTLLLNACSSKAPACEEIEEIMAQRHKCEELSKRIKQTSSVVVRTNLQQVYDEQCVDIRFYRDGFDDEQVCSSQKQRQDVKQAEQEAQPK